jgi:hypothetical protein
MQHKPDFRTRYLLTGVDISFAYLSNNVTKAVNFVSCIRHAITSNMNRKAGYPYWIFVGFLSSKQMHSAVPQIRSKPTSFHIITCMWVTIDGGFELDIRIYWSFVLKTYVCKCNYEWVCNQLLINPIIRTRTRLISGVNVTLIITLIYRAIANLHTLQITVP